MKTEKSWACNVTLRDGRCPDGCCGCVMAKVTSPVTGRVVELDYLAIPQEARASIVKAVMALPGRRNYECREDLSGSCTIKLTKSDLQTILSNEGACYA